MAPPCVALFRVLNSNINRTITRQSQIHLRSSSQFNFSVRKSSVNIRQSSFSPRFLTSVPRASYCSAAADQKTTDQSLGSEKHEFQAETRMLLDIVAKSLYSDKEVFIRELISNGSDAMEKVRYLQLSQPPEGEQELDIHIETDKVLRTFTIQDSGVGMTKEEMIDNLGTIARSGSKAFLEEVSKTGSKAESIIGQFGVGFYSSFMVANKVEVFSRTQSPDSQGYKWVTHGTGSYEIEPMDGLKSGTKIVVHLKPECREFSTEDTIKEVVRKYSNFVGFPIYLNGKKINMIKALWLEEPKDVKHEEHVEFYRFAGSMYDMPRFILHFKADAPINIRALIYFPETKPGMMDMSRDTDSGVSLYCRKVLIKNKAEVLPKWLRFCRGVIDSEDIPLNLSREMLQDSVLIRKLRTVLTNRIVRFLGDRARKDTESYDNFIKDYGIFLKEGILTSTEQTEKEEISRLLRYESSIQDPGVKVTLAEYCSRMKEGQTEIYYLAAPSRQLAETSAYFEALKSRDAEVLFCYEPYDELVLAQLQQYDKKPITSIEKAMRKEKETVTLGKDGQTLSQSSADEVVSFLSMKLKGLADTVGLTQRLDQHPCVVTVEEMAAARHFVKTQFQNIPEEQRYALLRPRMEINPSHPVIKKLAELKDSNPRLAELVALQLFGNAMVSAGLVEDPRTVLTNFNELLTLALQKH